MSYQQKLVFIIWLIFSPNIAFGEPIETNVTLRGYEASHTFYVKTGVDEHIEVFLEFERSGALVENESYLTVSLDEVPVKTVELSQLGNSLSLRPFAKTAGFHRVTVSTVLSVDHERCTPVYDRLAWLSMTRNSAITSEGDPDADSISERISRAKKLRTSTRGFENEEAFAIELAVQRFLITPILERATEDESGDATYIEFAPKTENLVALVERLAERVTAWDVAIVRLDDRIVFVGEATAIPEVVEHLNTTIDACGDRPVCFWRPGAVERAPKKKMTDDLAVWELSDLAKNGWELRGESNAFEFEWTIPKTWKLKRRPQIQFEVFRHEPFEMVIFVNGQPIEHFTPKKKESKVTAAIPERFWGEQKWDIRVEAQRKDLEDLCASAGSFAHISPASNLIVPREEALYASFGSSFPGDVSLLIDTEVSPVIAAQVVAPALRRQATTRFVEECERDCVRFVTSEYFSERHSIALTSNGALGPNPVASPEQVLLAERGGTVWNIYVGDNVDDEASRLFLQTEQALLMAHGAWISLKSAEATPEFKEVLPARYSGDSVEVGQTGVASRVINLVTALVVIFVIVMSGLYLWRRTDPSEVLLD